ncbi:MerR family DNA-binding transcriptional regulator [Bacillus sp. P14.5]|uniref:MerR family transcriptional regulator n=1 Tax=Bacillus sp. P14.5 TaxID=1983400 RepID=UPI000DEA82DD|nr:MerR family DNA-binding transcriptional regulator [Bacillus sp. P14.5]
MNFYRGIDITRPFKLSPDLLRKYESLGLIPHASRGKNNYRLYTETHKRFFEASRKMLMGFAWLEVAKMMNGLVKGDYEGAAVSAIEFQAVLVENYKESQKVISRIRETLDNQQGSDQSYIKRIERPITISEVSSIINIPVSTLRVWEDKQLFSPIRGDNNYRYFNQKLVNLLFIIKLLRLSGLGFERCQEILKEIEKKNYKETITVLENRAAELKREINSGLKALGYLNDLVLFLEETEYQNESH